MRKRPAIWALILCALLLFPAHTAFAHERGGHDKEIELVIFGNEDYKSTHPAISDTIQAIEDATYLAVDQYNGNGQDALANLQKRGIPDIPSSITEFNYTSNYSHRSLTHRGWNTVYPEKAHWPVRQQILTNTVKKELFTKTDTPLAWFPWLSEQVYGTKGSAQQQENFCILLYYTHVIGDHLAAKKYQDLAYVAPLVRPNDRDNPGVIPELMSCFEVLFESQSGSYTYITLMQEMDNLRSRSAKLEQSTGGINTDEMFTEYHQCVIDLLTTLKDYVPKLLENEEFFRDTFFSRY